MKIRVIYNGIPYVDFEAVESFDLLNDYLWITYEEGENTFINKDRIDYFHVMKDSDDE